MDPQMVALAGNRREAAEDVLTSREFPGEHWTQIHSTNLVERVNRELARRCDVVGIFPTPHAVLRRVGAVLEEIHEEWLVPRRSFSPRSMHHLLSSGQKGTEPSESGCIPCPRRERTFPPRPGTQSTWAELEERACRGGSLSRRGPVTAGERGYGSSPCPGWSSSRVRAGAGMRATTPTWPPSSATQRPCARTATSGGSAVLIL